MAHVFLSEDWFEEVARIHGEVGDLGLAPELRELVINLEVSGGPQGTVQARLAGGALARGFAAGAPTTLRLPFALAQTAFLTQDRAALVSAYLSGALRVEGDALRLLALQRAPRTPASNALIERIARITA